MRILLIDDCEDLRASFSETLKSLGHFVFEAENGVRGLEMLSLNNVDCVLSDIQMPMMDGVEFLKHAKSKFPNLPVFIMTGFSPYSKAEILNFGASGYFDKVNINLESLFSKAS